MEKPIYKIYEKEEDYELEKKKLFERLEVVMEGESKQFTSLEINWINNPKNYPQIKMMNLKLLEKEERLVMLAHENDIINGKPQLIHQTIQRIPLVKKVERKFKDKETGEWRNSLSWKLIDDRYDRRYDGNEIDVLSFDFWVYRIIDNGKEYYLLSRTKLTEEFSLIKGMKIDLNDLSDLNQSLKISKIATIFIVKEAEPAIKVLSKEKLILFSRESKEKHNWDEEGFLNYVYTHQNNNIYSHTDTYNLLRVSQLLSGNYEGYPLHIMKMGPVGSGKTTELEVLDFKFQETQGILEAANSKPKVLIPSFKEKPANLGYICNCNRIALIDELMKMIAQVITEGHQNVSSYLGSLNMLLEHKHRTVGSGNDNSVVINASSKVFITTNPLEGKKKLSHHLNVMDYTTLSRMVLWVQNREEVEKVYNKLDISSQISKLGTTLHTTNNPLVSPNTHSTPDENLLHYDFLNTHIISRDCHRGNREDFLTIYDSCQQFLCNFDFDKVKSIFFDTVSLSQEPMKQIWRSRGLHHSVLILDGITKFRCLFRDYDETFTSNEEDYQNLTRVLIKMIDSWDTNLSSEAWRDILK